MNRISDDQIIATLKARFGEYNLAIRDLQVMTSKLETLNQKLLASEELKSNFLSNIRNEINNPLASILAMSELLMGSSSFSAEEVASLGKTLHTEAFYLNFQMRNIFVVADLEAGETAPEYGSVHLNQLIQRLLNSFRHRLESKNLEVAVEWKGKVDMERIEQLEVVADSEKVYLILANLFDNAIEFNREKGKVKLVVEVRDKDFEIQVVDNGIGIPVSAQKDILSRFYQLDTGFNKRYKGHGLGLSVVKALVDLMEGKLNIDSTVGKGSRFSLQLRMPELLERELVSDDGNEFMFDDAEEFEEF